MRLGITVKLFAAILVTNVLMAVAFVAAIDVSVRRGFDDYITERALQRLQSLSQVLATEYAARGDWEFLRGNARHWEVLMWQARPGFLPPGSRPTPGDSLPAPFGDPPRIPRMHEARPGGPMPRRLLEGIVLEDASHATVMGLPIAPGDELLAQRVVSLGVTVGWLKVERPPTAGPDARFLGQILRTGWIVAGLALLLAALAALPLARRMLAPIRRLAAATDRLSSGDFPKPIEVSSNDELGQLTRDFNHLAAILRDAEQARRGFLADVSHDLRTPLAILRGELDALHEGVLSATPEAIASLRAEVATLEHLVTELYDLAVSDLGPAVYHFEPVDIAAVVAEAAAAFKERMAAGKLALDTSGVPGSPVVASAESRRITQLVNNLLENALRYTDPGGRVVVHVQPQHDDVLIDVMDSAPGVPEVLHPKLFERLFRVEPSRSREFGGAGLGLALCRSIAHAHGGAIEARPSPLGGLWIRVSLPRSRPAQAP
jgi:two-component system sensor histidine kinase BaeS